MDKHAAASAIIERALPDIIFDGWALPVLERAATQSGYDPRDIGRIFPNGVTEAVEFFLRSADAPMKAALANGPQKIREKIAAAVMARLEYHATHREALRRALTYLALPTHALTATRILAETADEIWHQVGDTSTDFNWYSKRAILSAVYSSTVLYWLDDNSKDFADTRAFLDRRIANVMQIEKFKAKLRSLWGGN